MELAEATVVVLGADGAGKGLLVEQLARLPNTSSGNVDGVPRVGVATARRRYVFLAPAAHDAGRVAQAGAHGAVLVVDVADGPLPATRAHVELSKQAGLPIVAVYYPAPPDLDVELAELVKLEMAEMLAKYEAGGDSTPTADGPNALARLAAALDAWTPMG